MKKWIWPLLVVLGLGGGGYGWYYRQSHKPPENPYKTAPVERRTISSRVTASGTLQAVVTVQVGSQVSGRVLELHADFNSKVKKGDLVAKLDPQLFQAALQQAQASYASAQANQAKAEATLVDANRQFERAKTQRTEGLAAQQDVDTADTAARVAKAGVDAAKSMVAQARAALNQDQVNLQLTIIKSPIDGVVISRSVDVGQTVAASLQAPVLFTIAEDLTKMHIEASVPESDVGRLAVDMPVEFTVDAFPGQRFKGTIEQVRNAAVTVQNVVTYTAIVAVDNPELKLRPGMTATVTIVTAKKDDVLAVPNAALRFKPPASALASASAGPGGSARARGPRPDGSARAKGSGAPGADDPERKTAYRLSGATPMPVRLTTGITDGSYTELLGDTLKEGDGVIVEGPAGDSGSSPASGTGQGQGQGARSGGSSPPRMRGMF
jgi:HlyD family secretion protein